MATFESGPAGVPIPSLPSERARFAREAALGRLIDAACQAFFFGDLLGAGLQLMAGAQGSFGLVLSHSLDCSRDVVVAARGQTMSIAFYPSSGLVAFGSESAATKVGMGAPGEDNSFRFDLNDVNGEIVLLRLVDQLAAAGPDTPTPTCSAGERLSIICAGSRRDATIVFPYEGPAQSGAAGRSRHEPRGVVSSLACNALLCVNILEGDHASAASPASRMWRRRLRLDGNPALAMLPDTPRRASRSHDPVGVDLLDIPRVVKRLTEDFDGEAHSPNRLSAWTFTSKLRQRLKAHRSGQHDGSVDLLVTGCEVSLWLGEQFASDLAKVYPKLKVVTLSANKLLGQLGQELPIPQLGFPFSATSHDFRGSVVLVLTHSGGTYAPLLCCSLFQAFTPNIFVVTSELDTQAARAVRSISAQATTTTSSSSSAEGSTPGSASAGAGASATAVGHGTFVELDSQFIFSTHAGFRPSEACSLSVVAMHHLLSHLLIFLMGYLSHFEHGEPRVVGAPSASICGSAFEFEDVRELAALSRLQADALRGIVGYERLGDTPASARLRTQGRRWAKHVLEGPLSWIVSLAYIAATVFVGRTPLGAIASAASGCSLPSPLSPPDAAPFPPLPNGTDGAAFGSLAAEALAANRPSRCDDLSVWLWVVRYVVCFFDVIIYAFLPWWTTVLIRLLEGRPWLHRVAGRSVLIGDVPWVAQSVEAFASKLFALSYSIASCSFMSANPADHLVHRHTHRVVRGSLLAVGRPDGRANSLTTAEAAAALAVSQASSIQNLGVTCESITIGHSLFKLPLSAAHHILPTVRPPFLCEVLRTLEGEQTPVSCAPRSKASPWPLQPCLPRP